MEVTHIHWSVAVAAALVWGLVGACSSTTHGTAAEKDAGSEASGSDGGGGCPDSEPGAGTVCAGEEVDCPYACGTTYCSCTSGFWACSVVLYGDGGACASVDGSPAPQEGAPCALACGPFVGGTCSFVCPGSEQPIGAVCETSGWHVLGSCAGTGEGGT